MPDLAALPSFDHVASTLLAVPVETEAHVVANTAGLHPTDWLYLRRHGIGGSDAAAIAGLDKYRSPFAVFLDKLGALEDEDDETEAARWGKLLEAPVRDETAHRTGHTIAPVNLLLCHETRTWQRANLDGLGLEVEAGLPFVYEGKTAGHYVADEWADDQVPDGYVLQGMHYLAVTGLRRLIFGVLLAGQRLAVRVVERDDELIEHLVTIEAEFWHRVQHRIPPEPDGSASCTDLLNHLWDVKPGAILTLSDIAAETALDLLAERAEASAALAEAKDRKDSATNRLRYLAGAHEQVTDPEGHTLYTWKGSKPRRLDVKALRADHPDLAEAYTREQPQRRFHVPKRRAKP